MSPNLWSRVKRAQIVQVLVVYAGASWLVLEVASVFIDEFGLPGWFFQAAILLLLIGLVILGTTAWVQMRAPESQTPASMRPPWEVDLVDVKETEARGGLPHLTWGRVAIAGIISFSLLFGFAGGFVLLNPPADDAGSPAIPASVAPGVAVLPFRAVGPDMDFWREGIVDLLVPNLDGVAGLRAVDPRNVLSRWRRAFGEAADAPDREAALAVAGETGASFAVMGSAVALGGGVVRLTAEVFDARSRESLGRAQVEGAADSILSLVDDLSVEILRTRVLPRGTDVPQLDLRSVTSGSLAAIRAYLEGEQQYRLGNWRAAHNSYSRALEADSTFALALYRLNIVEGWDGDPVTIGTDEGLRAAELSGDLPERIRLLLQGNAQFDLGDPRCIETLTQLVERYPDDVEGWYLLGESYLHIGAEHGQSPERYREALSRALSLDPGYGPAYIHLIEDAMSAGDSARARRLLDRYSTLGSKGPYVLALKLGYDLTWGDDSARAAAVLAVDTASTDALAAGYALAISPYTYGAAREFGWKLVQSERSRRALQQGHFILGLLNVLRGNVLLARRHYAAVHSLVYGVDSATANARVAQVFYLIDLGDSLSAASAVDFVSNDPGLPVGRFYRGAYAARQQNWAEVERQLSVLKTGATGALEVGDEESQRAYEGHAWALGVYAAIHRGELDAALRLYEDYRPMAVTLVREIVAYDLGKLAFSRGEFDLARDIFTGLTYSRYSLVSLSELRLAETLEALGEKEEASYHYARFLSWFAEPDPRLQPLRDRALGALQRLTQEPRS